MSLEAAQALMELEVKPREVSELMIDLTSQFDWMNQWIQGFSSFANNDYTACIQTLKHLEDTQPLLRNNVHLLVTLGRAQHYSGNFPAAALTLQRYHDFRSTGWGLSSGTANRGCYEAAIEVMTNLFDSY